MSTVNNIALLALLALASACSGGSTATEATPPVTERPTDKVEPTAELPSAESIISRAVEVTGGEAAYKAIKSYKVTGTFAIPAQKIVASLSIMAESGDRFLLAIEIPGIGTERVGSDGNTMWSTSAMTGSRLLTGVELDQMRRQVDMQADLRWKTYYKSARTTGTEEVDGELAHVVEMVDNNDLAEVRYYDVESGLLVKKTGTAKSQMGEMKTNERFTDYVKFGGLLIAKTVTVETMGMVQVATTESVEINVDIDDATFALPDDIKKLVDAQAAP